MDKILREIQREDKKNPYTDQELAEMLNVARSEVISVRKKNNILDSRERRKKILIKDISKIVSENPQMSERKITEILIENGYNISRSAVSKLLKVENLSKVYGTGEARVEALKQVSFSMQRGEFGAVVGASGSGKSTLLHMLGGLDSPTSGIVMVDGMNLSELNQEQLAFFRRRKVGFIFQQYNLIPDLNVYDNITFPLELDGAVVEKEFIQELLHTLHIADKKEMFPSFLSGGEQQRVAIARALSTKPAIILADEPTGNLDTSSSHDVIGLLKVMAKKYQQTMVVITHDLDIAQMADRIVRLRDGKLVGGSVSDVSE